jgi:hypothetical protein
MALLSTSRPALRARVIARLPATLQAAGGLKVAKENGVWTFSPDWSVLQLETTIPNPSARQLWTLDPLTGTYTRLSVQALINSLPPGPAGEDGSVIYVQNEAPATDKPEGSAWIDADSADLDLYRLTSGAWVDTGVNLKGATGSTGSAGANGSLIFVQNEAPSTSNPAGSIWIDADSPQQDLYQLTGGSWVDTGVNVRGSDGTIAGSTGGNDNRLLRSDGTGGTTLQNSPVTLDDAGNMSGVAALSTTTIEVGHASDTTVSRAAAGVLAVEGVNLLSVATGRAQGKETVWVPANAMIARITNGAAAGSVEMSTNKNMLKTLDFDTSTQEFAQFEIAFPKSWNLGTVTFQPIWSHASTTTNFGVVWGLAGVARSDDDPADVAFGTAQTSTDTGGTANDIYIGPESSAITIAGTPAAGDTVQFQINRTVSDGGDTMAVDARLHGIRLFFTTNASTDA